MLSGLTIGALSDMLASGVNVIKKLPLSLTFNPCHAICFMYNTHSQFNTVDLQLCISKQNGKQCGS